MVGKMESNTAESSTSTKKETLEDHFSSGSEVDLDEFCEVIVTFQCKICPFISREKTAFRNHLKRQHHKGHGTSDEGGHGGSNAEGVRKEESFQKNESEIGTSSPSGTVEVTGDEEEVFLCAECNIVFPSEESCCQHMIEIHGLKDFDANLIRDPTPEEKCVVQPSRIVRLPKSLTLEGGVLVPKKYRVTRDLPLKCSMCPVRFDSKETIKLHEQCHIRRPIDPLLPGSKSKNNGFNCLVCVANDNLETFSRWSKCAMHLWKTHKIDCDLYGCSTCQFKTYLMTKLKEHEGIHSNTASFKCETCHKSFKQKKQLRIHEKYHKEKMTKLPPPGDSRWYTPKECAICKRVLSDSKCLKKHISAVHNKLKPYVCNICGHTSARKAELQLHVRQHTGEKPYKCSKCEFVTGDHNSLRNHQLRHTEIRPYACPFCKYRCIQSCAYKKHMISVHPDKDAIFACPFCPLVSVNEVLFQAHIKDHNEGRVPSVDMHNESSSSPTPPETEGLEIESESTKLKSPPPVSKNKRKSSEVQYWMREDDSVDMVDTGGITIPAPVDNSSTNNSQNEVGTVPTEVIFRQPQTQTHSSPQETTLENTDASSVNETNGEKSITKSDLLELETPLSQKIIKAPHRRKTTTETDLITVNIPANSIAATATTELALEEVLNSDQTNNDKVFKRLLGLKDGGE